MKRVLVPFFVLLLSLPAPAALYDADQISTLYTREASGVRAYKSGDYAAALEYLGDTASKGFKESQYLLALMFMKGEGAPKSILIGLGWLGVAKESGNEEWINTFDSLYVALSEKQRSMVDEQVRRYIDKYGSATQGVTCAKRAAAGSRRIALRCDKTAGTYPEFEIELNP